MDVVVTIYCLLFTVKNFHIFHGLLHNHESFWQIFAHGSYQEFMRHYNIYCYELLML